jgi:SMODS-associating 2TM, beta-strand rich effector domain
MKMTAERYIKAIIYVAVLAWTVVLYVNHEAIHSSWLQPLSTVITVVLYAVMAFDLWLWKIPLLHGWFVKRPVIEGSWKVEIRSNWEDRATGIVIPPVEGYMVVRQTFSTLSLRLLTAESSSELVGTEIVCSADGLYCVAACIAMNPVSRFGTVAQFITAQCG